MLDAHKQDYELITISNFLQKLVVGDEERFKIYIVDTDGLMISASVADVTAVDNERINAKNCSDPVVAASAAKIAYDYDSWSAASGIVFFMRVPHGHGLYWAMSTELTEEHVGYTYIQPLKLAHPNTTHASLAPQGLAWHVVVAEKIGGFSTVELRAPSPLLNIITKRHLICLCAASYQSKDCLPGFFFQEGDCKECPDNMKCEGGATLPYPMRGYWVSLESYDEIFSENIDIDAERCIQHNCVGAEDAEVEGCFDGSAPVADCDEDALCGVGSTGILCGICEYGYYLERQTCEVNHMFDVY